MDLFVHIYIWNIQTFYALPKNKRLHLKFNFEIVKILLSDRCCTCFGEPTFRKWPMPVLIVKANKDLTPTNQELDKDTVNETRTFA